MQKAALFVFNGDPMCFIHVLMNTLAAAESLGLQPLEDMLGHPGMAGYHQRGYDVITF